MSAPEQKDLPSPRTMTTRTDESASSKLAAVLCVSDQLAVHCVMYFGAIKHEVTDRPFAINPDGLKFHRESLPDP